MRVAFKRILGSVAMFEWLPSKCTQRPAHNWRTVVVYVFCGLFSLAWLVHVIVHAMYHIRKNEAGYNEHKAVLQSTFCGPDHIGGTPNSIQADMCKTARIVVDQGRWWPAVNMAIWVLIEHVLGECWLPSILRIPLLIIVVSIVSTTIAMTILDVPRMTVNMICESFRNRRLRNATGDTNNECKEV